MKMIADLAHGRDNNFNLLRITAATAVLISHSWPISLGKGAIEPLFIATGYKLGTTAVLVFFAISGFFIAKSFDRRETIFDFIIARFMRLYPALLIALILTVMVGAILSELSLLTYLRAWHTWTYVPKNLSLRDLQWALPGVFVHNIYGDAINGSLWTLFWEVLCYTMVVLTGLVGLLRVRTFAVFALIFALGQFYLHSGSGDVTPSDFAMLSWPFALGMAFYVYRRFVPLSWVLALALFVLAMATKTTGAFYIIYPLAIAYGSLWLGLVDAPWVRRYNKLGDYSYGAYIYAFPVQQACIAILGTIGPWRLTAIALPITLVFAVMSWKLIEKPALERRHQMTGLLRRRRRSTPRREVSDGLPPSTDRSAT